MVKYKLPILHFTMDLWVLTPLRFYSCNFLWKAGLRILIVDGILYDVIVIAGGTGSDREDNADLYELTHQGDLAADLH